MTDQPLDAALDVAFARLKLVGGDPCALEEPFRTVVTVCSAQGVIDNGGLHFFFEADFPKTPPYATFVQAYRTIGADEAATALEHAIALFPFAAPHLKRAKRNAYLESFGDEETGTRDSPFVKLDVLCGNAEIWAKLAAFVDAHAAAFGLAPADDA